MQNRAEDLSACLIIFAITVLALFNNFEMMLTDSDTAWHMMAGHLMRESGTIPATDPFAYTSGGAPWVNLAWLWDLTISHLHGMLGWHGPVSLLSVTAGLTMVVLYQACMLRSNNGIASFFAVMLVIISIPLHLRSLWASNLFLALIFLLALLIEYRGWRSWWWYAMPALMVPWVNLHGGFVTAFMILGAFGLQALLKKQWHKAMHMTFAGLLSIAALGLNPYGHAELLRIVIMTFTTPAIPFIGEFQPSRFSWGFLLTFLYVPVFLFCVIHNKVRTSLAEAILGFGFLLLAFTSERYWTFVFLFSCPILAQCFAGYMKGGVSEGNPTAMRIAAGLKQRFFITHATATATGLTLCFLAFAGSLFTPFAARLSGLKDYQPYSMVVPAMEYVQKNHPGKRFLNDYELGGVLILASHGSFPVFIDGRGETAYPREVVQDFCDMIGAEPGWQKIFDRYQIDGLILSRYRRELLPYFEDRKGWKQAFSDDNIVVYVKD